MQKAEALERRLRNAGADAEEKENSGADSEPIPDEYRMLSGAPKNSSDSAAAEGEPSMQNSERLENEKNRLAEKCKKLLIIFMDIIVALVEIVGII